MSALPKPEENVAPAESAAQEKPPEASKAGGHAELKALEQDLSRQADAATAASVETTKSWAKRAFERIFGGKRTLPDEPAFVQKLQEKSQVIRADFARKAEEIVSDVSQTPVAKHEPLKISAEPSEKVIIDPAYAKEAGMWVGPEPLKPDEAFEIVDKGPTSMTAGPRPVPDISTWAMPAADGEEKLVDLNDLIGHVKGTARAPLAVDGKETATGMLTRMDAAHEKMQLREVELESMLSLADEVASGKLKMEDLNPEQQKWISDPDEIEEARGDLKVIREARELAAKQMKADPNLSKQARTEAMGARVDAAMAKEDAEQAAVDAVEIDTSAFEPPAAKPASPADAYPNLPKPLSSNRPPGVPETQTAPKKAWVEAMTARVDRVMALNDVLEGVRTLATASEAQRLRTEYERLKTEASELGGDPTDENKLKLVELQSRADVLNADADRLAAKLSDVEKVGEATTEVVAEAAAAEVEKTPEKAMASATGTFRARFMRDIPNLTLGGYREDLAFELPRLTDLSTNAQLDLTQMKAMDPQAFLDARLAKKTVSPEDYAIISKDPKLVAEYHAMAVKMATDRLAMIDKFLAGVPKEDMDRAAEAEEMVDDILEAGRIRDPKKAFQEAWKTLKSKEAGAAPATEEEAPPKPIARGSKRAPAQKREPDAVEAPTPVADKPAAPVEAKPASSTWKSLEAAGKKDPFAADAITGIVAALNESERSYKTVGTFIEGLQAAGYGFPTELSAPEINKRVKELYKAYKETKGRA